jgi:hypothetical protein
VHVATADAESHRKLAPGTERHRTTSFLPPQLSCLPRPLNIKFTPTMSFSQRYSGTMHRVAAALPVFGE